MYSYSEGSSGSSVQWHLEWVVPMPAHTPTCSYRIEFVHDILRSTGQAAGFQAYSGWKCISPSQSLRRPSKDCRSPKIVNGEVSPRQIEPVHQFKAAIRTGIGSNRNASLINEVHIAVDRTNRDFIPAASAVAVTLCLVNNSIVMPSDRSSFIGNTPRVSYF